MPNFNPLPPSTVRITDITARDGFQSIKQWIPTEVKIRVIDELIAAGVKKMEAASFISPKAIPQMRDAAEVVAHILSRHPDVEPVALVPNQPGMRNAAAAGVREVSYIISASPSHNKANINRTHEESLADLASVREQFPDIRINLSMSMAFGCPFEGEIKPDRVLWLLAEAMRRGIDSVSLCDTIGVGNPVQVRALLSEVRRSAPGLPLSLHMHDTHGMALANIFAALQCGVDCFETSAGGLGGCPFAPGAAGNVATEDTVNMLHRMHVETGLDLNAMLVAVNTVRELIGAELPGRLAKARSYSEFCFYFPVVS